MPLIENTNRIYKKYDTSSYAEGCLTYMQADEHNIVCIIVKDKERTTGVDKIMKDYFTHRGRGVKHTCVRGYYVGESLKEFDEFLKKYFKLK